MVELGKRWRLVKGEPEPRASNNNNILQIKQTPISFRPSPKNDVRIDLRRNRIREDSGMFEEFD